MNWRRLGWAFIGCICAPKFTVSAANSEASPIVVQPSQYWEGRDGTWSTFSLKVGTPAQDIRVNPSTVWPFTQAVSIGACKDPSYTACNQDHGQTFTANASQTWQEHAQYPLYPELNFTFAEDVGLYGADTIQLGENGIALDDQEFSIITTPHYYVGLLGLNPIPGAWSWRDGVQTPTLLQTLTTSKKIPSLSYSFTAGAQYRFQRVPGSLTLGGFDTSRATTTDVSFPIDSKALRPLGVAVQSISSKSGEDDSQELLSEPKIAYLDSTVAWLVLPSEACAAFEKAYGIQWNQSAASGAGLYTLTDDQHNKLMDKNPNVTFTLGTALSGGNTVEITLPYAAFNLNARFPYMRSSTPYFPLKRALNDSQITLGRVFFQEAMIVADFERMNFSVWPAKWEQNAKPNIVPIHAVDYTGPSDPNSPSTSSTVSATGLPTKTLPIALGVGLGVGLPVLTLIAFLVFARLRRRWPFDKSGRSIVSETDPAFTGGSTMNRGSADKVHTVVHEAVPITNQFLYEAAPADKPRPELAGVVSHREVRTDDGELPASPAPFSSSPLRELSGDAASVELSGVTGPAELSARTVDERRDSNILGELPSEPVPSGYLSGRSSAVVSRTPSVKSALISPRDHNKRPLPPLPPYKEAAGPSPISPQSPATGSSGNSARSNTHTELERSFRATRDARTRGRKMSEGARNINDGGWI